MVNLADLETRAKWGEWDKEKGLGVQGLVPT